MIKGIMLKNKNLLVFCFIPTILCCTSLCFNAKAQVKDTTSGVTMLTSKFVTDNKLPRFYIDNELMRQILLNRPHTRKLVFTNMIENGNKLKLVMWSGKWNLSNRSFSKTTILQETGIEVPVNFTDTSVLIDNTELFDGLRSLKKMVKRRKYKYVLFTPQLEKVDGLMNDSKPVYTIVYEVEASDVFDPVAVAAVSTKLLTNPSPPRQAY